MGPRPHGEARAICPGEELDRQDRCQIQLTKGTTKSGRSIWGSNIIPWNQWLTEEAYLNSTSTVVYVIDDSMDISSVLRSHGIPVTPINPYDTHSYTSTFKQVTTGGIMGMCVIWIDWRHRHTM